MPTKAKPPVPTPDRNVPQAAKQIGMNTWWIRRHLPDIPHYKLGSRVMFNSAELDAWLADQRRGPAVES